MGLHFSCSSLLLLVLLIRPSHSLGSSDHLRTHLRDSSTPAGQDDDGRVTMELWCVAKNNAEDAALQSALDWTCGPGGADCGPIQKGGPCYDAVDIERTASFAFNDYYLKHGLADQSCYFDNTAALTSLNPSFNNCKFPSSLSKSQVSFSGSATVGKEPASADFSCSDMIAAKWGWAFITFLLFFY